MRKLNSTMCWPRQFSAMLCKCAQRSTSIYWSAWVLFLLTGLTDSKKQLRKYGKIDLWLQHCAEKNICNSSKKTKNTSKAAEWQFVKVNRSLLTRVRKCLFALLSCCGFYWCLNNNDLTKRMIIFRPGTPITFSFKEAIKTLYQHLNSLAQLIYSAFAKSLLVCLICINIWQKAEIFHMKYAIDDESDL